MQNTVAPRVVLVTILLIGLAPVGARAQFPAQNWRISVALNGAIADRSSLHPDLSADGRYVAFASDATNLVAGDTNENTDIFVRDHVTGVTERVSVTWKGQEARGDSSCPSISADGRYVAFRSWAWNMYAGGANLGDRRFDLYVRDRVAGTTTRITVAHGGGEPLGQAGCPSISGDGTRVVFDHSGRNLVAEDPGPNAEWPTDVFLWDATDGVSLLTVPLTGEHRRTWGRDPVISADGNVVAFASGSRDLIPNAPLSNLSRIYVLNLSTGVMTHESVSTDGVVGTRNAHTPAISHDGRYVSFLTGSPNYAPLPIGQSGPSLYLRDTKEGTLTLVSPARADLECGPPDARFPCHMRPVTSHSISGDGRYLAFATRSTNLLPASDHKADQVYVWDRVTGRLRRTSVDSRGQIGEGCSLEPAIAADGRTIAYRTNASTLIPNNGTVFRNVAGAKWRCLPNGACRIESACPPAPRDCEEATRSKLVLLKHPPGGTREDRLSFRWQGEPLDEDFPNPLDGTEYHVCLYAGDPLRVEMDVVVPSEARWRELSNGHRMVGGTLGVSGAILRNGDSRARVTVKGKGPLLDAPDLPLSAPDGVTVQVHEVGGDRCFSSTFPTKSIRRNLPGDLSSEQGRDGRFAAQIP